jgi:hypothetical protein
MSKWRKVPILVLGFNRPDNLKSLLSQSALLEFERVIVSIDGPREGNAEDLKANNQIRLQSHESDFEHRFNSVNLGSRAVTSAITSVLEEFPNIIVVEDDLLLSPKSLKFIAERVITLEKNAATVGGYSPRILLNSAIVGNPWRESKYFCPWVWGTNQDVWSRYKQEISSHDLAQLVQSNIWNSLSPSTQAKWFLRFIWSVNNPNLTWDYQMQFMHFRESLISIRPWKSLVTNQGFNELGQRTHRAPIWNAKNYVDSISNDLKPKYTRHSNLVDSLTFAADHKILDGRFHNMLRNIYK